MINQLDKMFLVLSTFIFISCGEHSESNNFKKADHYNNPAKDSNNDKKVTEEQLLNDDEIKFYPTRKVKLTYLNDENFYNASNELNGKLVNFNLQIDNLPSNDVWDDSWGEIVDNACAEELKNIKTITGYTIKPLKPFVPAMIMPVGVSEECAKQFRGFISYEELLTAIFPTK
jgi:hypothetical protein